MYNVYQLPYLIYPYPCYMNTPQYNPYNMYRCCPYCYNDEPMKDQKLSKIQLEDYGPYPFVVNIEEATKQNNTFRTALWTGKNLQLTLMSIPVGGEIGLEIHPETDQFLRIEDGEGIVKMGHRKDSLDFQHKVYDDFSFIIPAGIWHNLVNTGNRPIKLYSIYAPPQHPYGTVHPTKDDAEEDHHH